MGFSRNIGLALFLLTLFWDQGAMAQSGCSSVLIGMAPCLNYVTGSSKTPSSSCCSSLAKVVKSQPECLCTALDGSTMAALGISINKTIALALPGACHVKTPPVSRCAGKSSNGPVMAPIKSPEPSGDDSSNGPSPTSIYFDESKQVQSNGETSDAAFGRQDMHHMLLSTALVALALILEVLNL